MQSIRISICAFAILALSAACGARNSASSLKDSQQCKYGLQLTRADVSTLTFSSTATPMHKNKCVLPANLFLCSEEPVKSTDVGYEVKLLPGRNGTLTEWSGSQDNDCMLLSLIAWKEMRSNVSGNGIKVVGPLVTPIPEARPIPAPLPPPSNGSSAGGSRIFNEARNWPERYFRNGVEAQCANFVRRVLATSCNKRFESEADNPIQSMNPWDSSVVGTSDLSPGYANSLAGSDIGTKIALSDAVPGDLVFFRNTYGDWAYGTITHVGIYAGDKTMIDRPTFDGPVMLRGMNMSLFVGALRVRGDLCN